MDNKEIASIFNQIAELLEIKQDNPFKIRAYQRAARNLESLSVDLTDVYRSGGLKALQEIPGIGHDLSLKIEEYLKTGKIASQKALAREFPKGILELINIPGMGPKTAQLLYKKLGIDSLNKLKMAAQAGKLQHLPGMGEKKEANILRGIGFKEASHGRFLLDDATVHAAMIVEELEKLKEAKKILPCGSLRRGQETVGDLDILVISDKPKPIMDKFVSLKLVKSVLAHGETKSAIVMHNGMQADLRVVPAKSFGAAAHYFTGSKGHNIHIRQLAQKKGWKVSEYGIFDAKGRQIGGQTEEEMFSKFGLQYIPPELREMRGEFTAAAAGKIPRLIELGDIRGDLHMHTTATDGENSLEEMAKAAKHLAYEYILITDHTQSTRVAHGLDAGKSSANLHKIKLAAKNISGIRLLAGAEIDILPDGSLDLPGEIIKQLDLAVLAVHSNFKMPREQMTARIIKAMQRLPGSILAHPTGRLLGEREAYAVDLNAVIKAAAKYRCILEVNAHPKRLDLTDFYCRAAKAAGVKIAISTDAHATDQLGLMKYGVITARRGWLEKQDVVNTWPLAKLQRVCGF
ncbi:hypothetical protein A2311_01115 [candidate division WOR-1 bacterium RIFOXYB2_FULL_48_7]|uniref:DNA polymerase beta n=1 Tax=candidate division WOR-1 bacterium RIFOXYB2_FULL_48_7 TaxID=1802583 RepID=A0A1F4TNI4_UNCSA|nr:MAG: hypothetical protein A2311_01115 [candidate division WOR-1 bacterium RIFOXYB2_FULL_48_7]